ncbi:MAG TPA: hypothetical protein VHX60_17250 [Acidobacteriaceae bacterium]|jgi:hypothetical protein|nr:hypothetical protein [Acidobacteriaceae bacterium]
MPVFFDRSHQPPQLLLEGAVDIGCAGELKAALAEAVGSGAVAHIVAESVTALDVTAIQLLWAAERASQPGGSNPPDGSGLRLAAAWPAALAANLREAGFRRVPFAPERQ